MTMDMVLQPCCMEHVERYGEIYADAFSGEPWHDAWTVEDATVHVREILESPQSYGLECVVGCDVVGFILGSSMLFHYGRTFEINDLAVTPEFQGRGIGKKLLEGLMAQLRKKEIKAVHLITAAEGNLPAFYAQLGFSQEHRVMLMGVELCPLERLNGD